MHLRKLPSGNWNAVAYGGYNKETGKQYTKSFTGPDRAAVKAEAAVWETKHRFRHDSRALAGAAEDFLALNAKTLSPSTQHGYTAIKRTLPDWLLRMPCHAIGEKDLQRYVNSLKVSPKTIRNRIGFISAVLKSQGIEMPPIRIPQAEVPLLNIPDSDTVKRTIAAAEADTELWICIMLAATGPLREGEIAALSLDDIDRESCIVHVHHDLVLGSDNKYHLKPPKTRSSDRYIDMPRNLIEAIYKQGYVTRWKPKGIYNRFRTLLDNNGIPPYRFHDLRHFCISELLSQGIDEIYVAERSGHSDYATMKRYTHALGNRRGEVSKKILGHFDALFVQKNVQKNF